MRDAEYLVTLAEAMTNVRSRSMRRELQDKIGSALRVPKAHHANLDCLQSRHVFITFLPGSELSRASVDRLPLLRQALVAGCAATETYLADKVMSKTAVRLKPNNATKNLKAVPMSVEAWLDVRHGYKVPTRGLQERVLHPYIREQASTSPSKVGLLLSLVGVDNWARRVDDTRGVPRGETVGFLERVTARRNRIAHTGDRVGHSRGRLTIEQTRADLGSLREVVPAIEGMLA